MGSLISGDNIWLVWASVISLAAFAFISEQKWKWAQVLSSAIVGIFGAMLLANLRIFPTTSPVYGSIMGYILPLSIPLLLFKCDLRKIIRESGKLFLIMNVGVVASCIGAFIAGKIFIKTERIDGIVAMIAGAYTGGTVNLAAMGEHFKMGAEFKTAAAVIVNIFVILVLLFYSFMTISKWFRRTYRHPHIDAFESGAKDDSGISAAAKYWKPKPISLKDIALTLATAFVITAASHMISSVIVVKEAPKQQTAGAIAPVPVDQQTERAGLPPLTGVAPQTAITSAPVTAQPASLAQEEKVTDWRKSLRNNVGSIYLIMPTLTLILIAIFPKYFNNLAGAEEMGTFMIMLFFVSIGCMADLRVFFSVGTVILYACIITIVLNLGLLLLLGRLFKWSLEDIITCSNATIGGPTTAAAFAVNKGWTTIIAPSLLIGLYGYAIGNYMGVLVAALI